MCECEYCGRKFEKYQSLAAHKGHCDKNPNRKRTHELNIRTSQKSHETYRLNRPEKYIIKEFECSCKKCGKPYIINTTQEKYNKGEYTKYCSLSCRNGHKHSEESKQKIGKKTKEYNLKNPGYNLKTYYCKVCGTPFTIKDIRNVTGRQYCSAECKHKFLSENTGGYRKGSGRGKSGWYKGIYCDSTWELAYVIYNLDNGKVINRCKEARKYIYNGEERTYFPDFNVNGEIVEIKGYKTDQWMAKLNANPDVKVLYEEDMKFYLNYAIEKYGIDFIKLYDNSNPKLDFNNLKYLWMHKGNKNTLIKPNRYEEYLNEGWIRGRVITK